jgi:methylmalonyl-CoA/ethylmalonyl-CoA epimerase
VSAASTNPTAFGLAAIGQIALSVSDIGRAAAFYRDALGLRVLFQVPGMAFFDCGGVRLMISAVERAAQSDGYVIYFKVAEIQKAYEALAGRGVAFERAPELVARMPDHDLWMAFFRDPDRNLLAMMAEEPRS